VLLVTGNAAQGFSSAHSQISKMATSTQTLPGSAAKSLLSTDAPKSPPTFSFTPFLRSTYGHALIATTPVCPAFAAGHCPLGRRCPDRHPTPSQQQSSGYHHFGRQNDNYVCKHWLKALCMKGDNCDYLHEYNLRKMSECQFYNQNGYCQNGDECLYLHVKEESRLPLCEDYNKAFCEKGPRCGKRHVRRKLCKFYLAGFCPEGRECTEGVHLKVGGEERKADGEDAASRRRRADEMDRRDEDEGRRDFGRNRDRDRDAEAGRWRGRGGRGAKWKNKRDR
jgi:cleavage and polyadenylation specificity factor subunit 4